MSQKSAYQAHFMRCLSVMDFNLRIRGEEALCQAIHVRHPTDVWCSLLEREIRRISAKARDHMYANELKCGALLCHGLEQGYLNS